MFSYNSCQPTSVISCTVSDWTDEFLTGSGNVCVLDYRRSRAVLSIWPDTEMSIFHNLALFINFIIQFFSRIPSVLKLNESIPNIGAQTVAQVKRHMRRSISIIQYQQSAIRIQKGLLKNSRSFALGFLLRLCEKNTDNMSNSDRISITKYSWETWTSLTSFHEN